MLSSEPPPQAGAECRAGNTSLRATSEADEVVVVTSHGDSSLAVPSAPALAVHLSVWGTLYSVGATCLLFAIILVVLGVPPTYISTRMGRRRYVAIMIPILAIAATVLHFFIIEYPLRMLNAFLYDTTVEADRHRAAVEAATTHARDAEQRRAFALNDEANNNNSGDVVSGLDIEREIIWMNKQLQYLERLHRMPLHPLLHVEHKTLHNFLASLIAVQRAHLIALKRQYATELPYTAMGASSSLGRRHSTLRFGSERPMHASLSPTASLARTAGSGQAGRTVTPIMSATVVVEPKQNGASGIRSALASKGKSHVASQSSSSPPAVIVGDVDDSRVSKGGVHVTNNKAPTTAASPVMATSGKAMQDGSARPVRAPLVTSVNVAPPVMRDGGATNDPPLQPAATSNGHDETALLHTATDLSDEDDVSGTYGFSYSTKRSLTLLDPLLSTLHHNERNTSLTPSPSRVAGVPSPRSLPPSPANVDMSVTPHTAQPAAAMTKDGERQGVPAAKMTNTNDINAAAKGGEVSLVNKAAAGSAKPSSAAEGRPAHVDPTVVSHTRRPLLSPDGIPTIDLHRGDRFAGDTANTFFYIVVTPDTVQDSSVFDGAASRGVRVFAFEANVAATKNAHSNNSSSDGSATMSRQRFTLLPDIAVTDKAQKSSRRPYKLTVGGVQSEPRPASEAERQLVDFLRCVVEDRTAMENEAADHTTGVTSPDLTSLAVPNAPQGDEEKKNATLNAHTTSHEADLFSEIDVVKLKQHLPAQPLCEAESYILSWAVLPNRPMRLTFLAVNLHESEANEQLGRRTTVGRRTVPVIECMVADVYCVLTSARVMTNEAGDVVHSLELNGICIESKSLSQSDTDSYSARSGASDRSVHIGKVVTERRVRKLNA